MLACPPPFCVRCAEEAQRQAERISQLQTQIEASRHDILRAQGADAAVKGVVESVQQELANVRSELTARELLIADLKVRTCSEASAGAMCVVVAVETGRAR